MNSPTSGVSCDLGIVVRRGEEQTGNRREPLRGDVGIRPEEAALRHLAASRSDKGRLADTVLEWMRRRLQYKLLTIGE